MNLCLNFCRISGQILARITASNNVKIPEVILAKLSGSVSKVILEGIPADISNGNAWEILEKISAGVHRETPVPIPEEIYSEEKSLADRNSEITFWMRRWFSMKIWPCEIS